MKQNTHTHTKLNALIVPWWQAAVHKPLLLLSNFSQTSAELKLKVHLKLITPKDGFCHSR